MSAETPRPLEEGDVEGSVAIIWVEGATLDVVFMLLGQVEDGGAA